MRSQEVANAITRNGRDLDVAFTGKTLQIQIRQPEGNSEFARKRALLTVGLRIVAGELDVGLLLALQLLLERFELLPLRDTLGLARLAQQLGRDLLGLREEDLLHLVSHGLLFMLTIVNSFVPWS